MPDRQVLMIAYHFPPLSTSGVQRSVKFVKYLVKKGWQVSVLTVQDDRYFARDSDLFKDIPSQVSIYRTRCISPDPLINLLQRLRLGFTGNLILKCMIPDPHIGWLFSTVGRARRIMTEKRIDLLYTTSAPYTSHLIGYMLKRRLRHIRWVADFRDPWTQNVLLYHFLGKTRQKLDRVLEKRILNACDHVIAVTRSCRLNLIRAFALPRGKVTMITNGYDEDDFPQGSFRVHNNRFTLVFSGSAYDEYNPENFITAITGHILESSPEMNVVFVGGSSAWAEDYLKRHGLYEKYSRYFTFKGYVGHEESVRLVQNADVLLLTIPNNIPYNMTGKIFEYMRSNVPILAVVPIEGDAAEVIRKTRTGCVVDPDRIEDIAAAVDVYYTRWKAGTLHIEPDCQQIAKFERPALTDQLINVFNRL